MRGTESGAFCFCSGRIENKRINRRANMHVVLLLLQPFCLIPMLYFIWSNPNKTFTVVNAVAINVMVQCSETELDHYINANGINPMRLKKLLAFRTPLYRNV